MTAQSIIEQALALPAGERVRVAEAILESVEARQPANGHSAEDSEADEIDAATLAKLRGKLPYLYSIANQAPADVEHYHNDAWK